MTITPVTIPMLVPVAESSDGDGKDAPPSESAVIEHRMESNFTAADDSLVESAMDATSPTPMNDRLDEEFDAFTDAGERPTPDDSNFPSEFLAPVEGEGVSGKVQSADSGSALLLNPSIPSETDTLFDAFDGTNENNLLVTSNSLEINGDCIFDSSRNDTTVDPMGADVSTPLPNNKTVEVAYDCHDEHRNVLETTVTATSIDVCPIAECTPVTHTESATLQGDTFLVPSTSEGDNDVDIADDIFSAFDAMDIQENPKTSVHVFMDDQSIVPAADGIFVVSNDDSNNASTSEFPDIDDSNVDFNETAGGSHCLNSSEFPEHETESNDIRTSATSLRTEARASENSSMCNEVAILDESADDDACLSTDLDVFARESVRERNDGEPLDEMHNTEKLARTAIGMMGTDFDGEDFASSNENMPHVTSLDEDFGGFAFSEVHTEPIDGFLSFDEATPTLSALEGHVESINEIVDQNSTTLPEGCATDDAMTNNVETISNDVNDNEFDLVLSNTGHGSEVLKELEHSNGFDDMASHENSLLDKQSEDVTTVDGNGFGDFEDVSKATMPILQGVSVVEQTISPAEMEFGDASRVQVIPDITLDTARNDHHDNMVLVSEHSVTSQPFALAINDDEFGDFGGFEFGDAPADVQSPEAATIEAMTASDDDGDEFGEFGDFDAFEEAPLVETIMPPIGVPDVKASDCLHENAEDDFGDFGDFEAFDSAPSLQQTVGIDARTESGRNSITSIETQNVSILNDSARRMFQDVFAYDDPAAPSLGDGGTCSHLPFDCPMSKILVSTYCWCT
jgi:hypothetical protein